MAGPEPYPQEKWTPEQEAAYAEGRKSAQAKGSSGKGPASRSGRKRYVRTAAGEKRYKVPIGSEIGTARNAKAAQAQKDTESTGRYNELVGSDPKAQAAAMRGLSDDQLQRLSQVAYSFRSSDQNVVRLRVGVANELARRGFNVRDFGGLGGGSARSAGPAPRKAGAVAPSSNSQAGIQAAMHRMYGKDRRLSVPMLRKSIGVFGKVRPDRRQVVARYLVNQAVELSATHFLNRSVIDAADLSPERRTEVIELAGKWKHGWIPLDGTAMRSKMKGGNGKPWWSGGKQKRRGNVAGLRRSVAAGNAQRDRKAGSKLNPEDSPAYKEHLRRSFAKTREEAKHPDSGMRIVVAGKVRDTESMAGKALDEWSDEEMRKIRPRLVRGLQQARNKPRLGGNLDKAVDTEIASYERALNKIDTRLKGSKGLKRQVAEHNKVAASKRDNEFLRSRNPTGPRAVAVETLDRKGGKATSTRAIGTKTNADEQRASAERVGRLKEEARQLQKKGAPRAEQQQAYLKAQRAEELHKKRFDNSSKSSVGSGGGKVHAPGTYEPGAGGGQLNPPRKNASSFSNKEKLEQVNKDIAKLENRGKLTGSERQILERLKAARAKLQGKA